MPKPFVICRLRGLPVAATPEELARQQVIAALLAAGYPWHLWRCEVGHPQLGRQAGRADLLFNPRETETAMRADAVIEVKAHAPRPADHLQAQGYAGAFSASLYAVTDGATWAVCQRAGDRWLARATFPAFRAWQATSA